MKKQFVIQSILFVLFNLLAFNITFAQETEIEAEEILIEQLKRLGLDELTEVRIFDPEAGLAARKVQRLTNL